MTDVTAQLNNIRIAPRKVRQVVNLVRGKNAVDAKNMLTFTVNKSARDILKLLNSALANAKHDFQLDEENLFISKITVDEGPKLKRWHAMSRGRAFPILKRTSRITLVVSEKNVTPKTPKKSEKTAVKNEEPTKKTIVKTKKNLTKKK